MIRALVLLFLLGSAAPAYALPIYEYYPIPEPFPFSEQVYGGDIVWRPVTLDIVELDGTVRHISFQAPFFRTEGIFYEGFSGGSGNIVAGYMALLDGPAGSPLSATPEPGTLILLGTALVGVGWKVRRRWRRPYDHSP
jgi:hypothetical protein